MHKRHLRNISSLIVFLFLLFNTIPSWLPVALAEDSLAPVISAIDDISIDEDTAREITFTVEDDTTAAGEIIVSAVSSNTNIIGHPAPVNNEGSVTLLISPKQDKNGDAEITVTATDADNISTTEKFRVHIQAINDAPAAADDSDTCDEDKSVTVDVLANDCDPDGDTLTVEITQDPQHGSATVNESKIVYTPDENWHGNDMLTYSISDGAKTDTAEVTIQVASVNDKPVAKDKTAATEENQAVEITMEATDIEGDTLQYALADTSGIEGKGTLGTVSGDKVTFTPDPYWNGSASFTYKANDGTDDSEPARVDITVTPVNYAPAAQDISLSTDEDTTVEITLSASDPDGDSLTFVIVDSSGLTDKGSLGEISGGRITFTPAADFNGSASFTYRAYDGEFSSDTVTATITVEAQNDAPKANDDEDTTAEETSVELSPLVNDRDVDSDTEKLVITGVQDPPHGSAVVNEDKDKITYTPDTDFNGEDTFTYTIEDTAGASDTAQIRITVTPVNDAPEASEDTGETEEETEVTLNVTDNDSDADNDTLTVVSVTQPLSGGTAFVAGSDSVKFVPGKDVTGSITFYYTIEDAAHAQSSAKVTITVHPENDAPTAVADTATVNEDDSAEIEVLNNDTDPDLISEPAGTEELFIVDATGAGHGTLTVTQDKKTIIYEPDDDYNGEDTFSYTMKDKAGLTSQNTVTVTISPVNDLPAAKNDSYTINEDTPKDCAVLDNDTDKDFDDTPKVDAHTIIGVTTPAHGTAANMGTYITYEPESNWSGTDTFNYTLEDKGGARSTATVTITVTPVNDEPQFASILAAYSTEEDTSKTITFDISDVETATESLMLQCFSSNQNIVPDANITLNGIGTADTQKSITVIPKANANGPVDITLRLSDGFLVKTFTTTLTVTAVNDAPTARTDNISFTEDTPLTINKSTLLSNDTDIENDTLSFVSFTQPEGFAGTLTDNGTQILFTPNLNVNGTLTFTYIVSDGAAQSQGQVNLNGIAVNDAPVITMDSGNVYTTTEDYKNYTGIAFAAGDVETSFDKLVITASCSNTQIIEDGGIKVVKGTGGACTLDITPNADKYGTPQITVTVSDGTTATSQTFDFHVSSVPDEPQAVNDTYSMAEDTSLSLAPLENDYDRDGDTLTIETINGSTGSTVSVTNGTITKQADDTLIYIPNPGFDGTESFEYTISDNSGLFPEDTATITITISGENDPPHFSPIADQEIDEDTDTGAIAFGMDDPDGGEIFTYEVTSSNTALIPLSKITLDETNKTILCEPEDDLSGSANITLKVTDRGGLHDSVSFKVTVRPVNDAPRLGTFTDVPVTEDTPKTIDLLADATDADGDTLYVTTVYGASHGTFAPLGNGRYSYTPASQYNGSDSFTYVVADGGCLTTGTGTILVSGVNDAPYAYDDYLKVTLPLTEKTVISPLNNDGDYDEIYGDTISIAEIVSGPSNGTAQIAGDTIEYTPDTSAAQYDLITYKAKDASGALSNTATIHIARTDYGEAYAPVAFGFYKEIMEDATAKTWPAGIFDADSSSFTVHIDPANEPQLGTVTISGTSIIYTPAHDANGDDVFKYYVEDDLGHTSNYATVHVRIFPVNDAPVITGMSTVTTIEDQPSDPIYLTISDAETSAANLIFSAYSGDEEVLPKDGINVSRLNGDVTLTLTPAQYKNGSTTVYLVASDGLLDTRESFTFNITPVNNAPDAKDYSVTTNEEVPVTIAVKSDTTDADHLPAEITVEVIQAPEHGSVVIKSGAVEYTPAKDYFGSDSFQYKLTDPEGAWDTGTVSLTVSNINDAPYFSGLDYVQSTMEDEEKTISFSLYDADGDTLTIGASSSETELVKNTRITLGGSGTNKTITINPEANQYGITYITISANDGIAPTQYTFELRVLSKNDLPLAGDDAAETDEDNAVTVNLLTNDSDLEDTELYIISVTDPTNGSIRSNQDGTVTYTPKKDFFGTDEVTYTVSDTNEGTATAKLTVTVSPVNDAPVAVNESFSINEDAEPFTIDVFNNDYDVDNDKNELTITGYSTPSKGTLEMIDSAHGIVKYSPTLDKNGSDSFTYTLSDGMLTGTGTVTINIAAENDAPRITPQTAVPYQFNEDTTGTIKLDIYDPETAPASLITQVTSLNQSIIKDTAIRFLGSGRERDLQLTPLANKNGSLNIKITVSDGVNTTEYEYPVIVLSVNDKPTLSNYTAETAEDTAVSGTVKGTDLESAQALLTYALKEGAGAQHGTAVVQANGSWTYTPAANYNGTDTFTIVVSDNDISDPAETAEGTVTVTVNPANDAPTAVDDTVNMDEDTTATFYPAANDTDPDLLDASPTETLTVKTLGEPSHGAVLLSDDKKTVYYTPYADYNGTDSIAYTVKDAYGQTSDGVIHITVAPVNDAPVAGNDTLSTDEDTQAIFDVLANDTDVDKNDTNSTETIMMTEIVTEPQHGTAVIENNKITYTPANNYYGADTLTYKIADQAGVERTADVAITVNSVNDLPQISGISGTIEFNEDEDTGDLAFIISDVEDAASELTLSADSDNTGLVPKNFTTNIVLGGADGSRTVKVKSAANKNGNAAITITVKDKNNSSGNMSFVVKVNAVNDAPVAVADIVTTAEDTPSTFSVMANDTDVDLITNPADEQLSIATVGSPSHGTAVKNGTGILYTPDENFSGEDSFTYTISDKAGAQSGPATVTVTVNAANDAPELSGITGPITIDEDDTTGAIAFTVGDIDDDAAALTVTAASTDTTLLPLARITLGGSGASRTVTAAPAANRNGYTDITLTVSDGTDTDTLTFRLNVTPVNDDPEAVDDDVAATEDTLKNIAVLLNDKDTDITINPAQDSLKVVNVTQPAHGTAAVGANETSVDYTPASNYNGTDSFTYTIRDTGSAESTATINITVQPVNDAPAAVPDKTETDEDNEITFDLIANDTDPDLSDASSTENLTIVSAEDPPHGTVTVNTGNKTITYTPDENWNGTDAFSYTMKDTGNIQRIGSVEVAVKPVNDDPEAVDDDKATDEDNALVIHVLDNDTDTDLLDVPLIENLTVIGVTQPANGKAEILTGSKTVKYTPDKDYNGSDSFTYTLEDQGKVQKTATVTMTVNSVNDAPKANNDTGETQEDTPVTVSPLANDTDTDLITNPLYEELTIKAASASHGSIVIASDKKSFDYTPAADFNGTDTLFYTIKDRDGLTSAASVAMTVRAVNDHPQAEDDHYTIEEDTVNTFNVLSNDTDADLYDSGSTEKLTIIAVGTPGKGTASIKDNKIVYKMDQDFDGDDSFEYTIADKAGIESGATVYTTVDPVNDPPTNPVFREPLKGSWYKKGQTVHVRFDPAIDVDADEITYTLEFFNGKTAKKLTDSLKTNEYDFVLPDEDINTESARFYVQAFDEHGLSSQKVQSALFIIDNAAPVNTVAAMTADGKAYNAETWTNKSVMFTVSATQDAIPFTNYIRVTPADGTPGEWVKTTQVLLSVTGDYTVEYKDIDALEHETKIRSVKILIDKIAPPALNVTPDTDKTVSGTVTLTLGILADTGGSGNAFILLPDGKQAAITGETMTYEVSENKTYTFVLADNAGNQTPVSATVANIDSGKPTVTVNNHGYTPGTWVNEPITVSLIYKDEGSSLAARKYIINENAKKGLWKNYSGDITLSQDGQFEIQALAKDSAGNTGTGVFGAYKIDTARPELKVELSGDSQKGFVFGYTGTDGLSGVASVRLPDGRTVSAASGSYAVTQNGNYEFACTDAAGNETKVTVKCDKIEEEGVPALAQTIPFHNGKAMEVTDGGYTGESIDVKLDGGEVDAFIWTNDESIDNTQWRPVEGTVEIKDDDIPEGVWYLHLKKDGKVSTVKYVIDRTPPEITHKLTNLLILQIAEVTATDTGSGMDWLEGDGSRAVDKISKIYFANGSFVYAAADKAGNKSEHTLLISGIFPWWIVLTGIAGLIIIYWLLFKKRRIYRTGEKPGEGTYRCIHCKTDQPVFEEEQELHDCLNCGKHKFKKLRLK